MGLDATARRRLLGVLVLLAALGMLIAGETVLKQWLSGFRFLVYWLGCFFLTGLAILSAYLDVRALRRETRREERDLIESTIKDIQAEPNPRRNPPGKGRR
ncbi:MAG TPA: hypothetical protein VG146_22755 [Verrucomicrobiae bacterium]|nr:hypothetical protein [Verrucomicrobiae bacterium]